MSVGIAKYLNPFGGKPKPLTITGLFLFEPEAHLKIVGDSHSACFKRMHKESLYKRIEAAKDPAYIPSEKMINELVSLLPTDTEPALPLREALSGNLDAQNTIHAIGSHEAYFGSVAAQQENIALDLLLSVEAKSRPPLSLIVQGRYGEAAKAIEADKFLKEFVCDRSIDLLTKLKSDVERSLWQASVALEVHLSYVAAIDVQIVRNEGSQEGSLFECLLPSIAFEKKNTAALFFGWLKQHLDMPSIGAILRHPNSASLQVDEITVRRWSSGRHFPDIDQLDAIAQAFFDDPDYPPIVHRYWGAKHLNFLGHFAQRFTDRCAKNPAMELAPWPLLPFGHDTYAAWCRTRYDYWLNFHR